MNWNWTHKQKDVLTDKATTAEARLVAVKKAAKTLKKSVEDSLKTAPNKNRHEDLEVRKRRTSDFVLGESVANAVHSLNEERLAVNLPYPPTQQQPASSPLNLILERFANLEKTIGHMQAVNESELFAFIGSDTPISKLLSDDIPQVNAAKKDLEQLIRRQIQSQNALEKELKRLDRMSLEDEIEPEALSLQREKKDKLAYEVDNLTKDVSMEQDKLTSTLLTLVSRENRYAQSVFELMRIKKQFYENAFKTIEAELPNIERILQETNVRPVFGERLEDHLRSTGRAIAFPIALTITALRSTGLNDEGLFRISPKQIKLDKFKAHLDSHQPLHELLGDCDAHLHSALLKCYLRELPVPLLGEGHVYDRWIKASNIQNPTAKMDEFTTILNDELSPCVTDNVQYVIKFLHELAYNSQTTKMTPQNLAIVLGPTLLWSDQQMQQRAIGAVAGGGGAAASAFEQQAQLENVISVVATLIESYPVIFPRDDVDQLVQEDTDLRSVRLSLSAMNTDSPSPVQTPTTPTSPQSPLSQPQSPPPPPPDVLGPLKSIGTGALAVSAVNAAGGVGGVGVGVGAGTVTASGHLVTPPKTLTVESPSPNHKRKASIRSMGRNFMAKINSPTGKTPGEEPST